MHKRTGRPCLKFAARHTPGLRTYKPICDHTPAGTRVVARRSTTCPTMQHQNRTYSIANNYPEDMQSGKTTSMSSRSIKSESDAHSPGHLPISSPMSISALTARLMDDCDGGGDCSWAVSKLIRLGRTRTRIWSRRSTIRPAGNC
ncbi:hypothetical protein quinque_008185 [Culex quinquefasciatus]